MQLTSRLISIVGRRDVDIITAVHANNSPEVVDLIKTQLAVQVKEQRAVLYRQVRMCFNIPDVHKILIVQHVQCIPKTHHKAQTRQIPELLSLMTRNSARLQ